MREDLIAVRIERGDDQIVEVVAVEIGAGEPALAGREARLAARKEVGEHLLGLEHLVWVRRVADDRHVKNPEHWGHAARHNAAGHDDLVPAVIVEVTHHDLAAWRIEYVGRKRPRRADGRVGRVEEHGAADRARLRTDDDLVATVVVEITAGDAVARQEQEIEGWRGQRHRGTGLSEGAKETRRADDDLVQAVAVEVAQRERVGQVAIGDFSELASGREDPDSGIASHGDRCHA